MFIDLCFSHLSLKYVFSEGERSDFEKQKRDKDPLSPAKSFRALCTDSLMKYPNGAAELSMTHHSLGKV